MREILFRAKRKDDGEWVTGFYTHFADDKGNETHRIYSGYAETDCGDYYPDFDSVLPETVGEYTGLTDKNGVRIFEGDIVKIYDSYDLTHYDDPDYQISKVFYFDGALCVEHHYSDYDFTVIGWIEDVEYEVIGNIYDNPELLGGDGHVVD